MPPRTHSRADLRRGSAPNHGHGPRVLILLLLVQLIEEVSWAQLVGLPDAEEPETCSMSTLQAMCSALKLHGAVSFCRSEAVWDVLEKLAPLAPRNLTDARSDATVSVLQGAAEEAYARRLSEVFVFPGAHVLERGNYGFPFGAERGHQMFCPAADALTLREVSSASQLAGGHRVTTLTQQIARAGVTSGIQRGPEAEEVYRGGVFREGRHSCGARLRGLRATRP